MSKSRFFKIIMHVAGANEPCLHESEITFKNVGVTQQRIIPLFKSVSSYGFFPYVVPESISLPLLPHAFFFFREIFFSEAVMMSIVKSTIQIKPN